MSIRGGEAAASAPGAEVRLAGQDYFQIRADLGAALFALTTLAHDLRAPSEIIRTIGELGTSLREPFLFVAVGEVKAGKSSLLNALFGRELSKVDVLPATEKIYLFRYGEDERDVPISPVMAECYRNVPLLQHFHIVDTPGTNTVNAEHETLTRQFVPMADLCLCVFSATNPWGATAWQFLQHLHRKWLKKVVFILQQADLRAPEEIGAILTHMQQTMVQKVGDRNPIFAVSARQAAAAKKLASSEERERALAESGLAALESYIQAKITGGETRNEKLRSVCRSAQVIIDDLGGKLRTASQTLARDLRRLEEVKATLAEREEQSLRQIGGMLWTLAQSFERAEKRAELLLGEKLTAAGAVKSIFGHARWEQSFQEELEKQQRESLMRHIGEALEQIQADLRSVWKQLHDFMERSFADQAQPPTLPDLDRRRRELLERIEKTILEKAGGPEFEAQMNRLFARTATWVRVPAGVLATGGVATAIAAGLAKLTLVDLTGSVAAVGALAGTAAAVARRKTILARFRKHSAEKRDQMMHAIDDHLRHALNLFYQELESTLQPLQAFCAGQRRSLEPHAERLRELEQTLIKCAGAIGPAPE